MRPVSFKRHRFPADIIRHAVWLYFRFNLSFRNGEEMLAQRGSEVSYETIRCWTIKFGPQFARAFKTAGPHLHRGGIWMKWSATSEASKCICGAPSTTKAKCWTFNATTKGHPERHRAASRSLMIFGAWGTKLAIEQTAAATPTALIPISDISKARSPIPSV